jgi:hypothetical protein
MTLIGCAALLALSLTPRQEPAGRLIELAGPEGGVKRLLVQISDERLPAPKISPKQQWVFEWVVSGLGRQQGGDTNYSLRFRVFAQMRRADGDPAPLVARMALRLWDFNVRKLRLDHNPAANIGIVDFYLCFGGKAGGEQLFVKDTENGRETTANAIFIYAVQTFTDSVEMAREVAHEYGHATLLPVRGYSEPEEWASGFMGEKLYLKWLRDELAAKRLGPQDAMGASAEQLDAWVKKSVDPLVLQAALTGPDVALLSRTDKRGMNAFLGLVMFAEAILPPSAFLRSLKLIGSTAAIDYPKAIVLAATEMPSYVLNVPPALRDRRIWIPLGKGRLIGQVGIIRRQGDWAQIEASADAIRVENPQP